MPVKPVARKTKENSDLFQKRNKRGRKPKILLQDSPVKQDAGKEADNLLLGRSASLYIPEAYSPVFFFFDGDRNFGREAVL